MKKLLLFALTALSIQASFGQGKNITQLGKHVYATSRGNLSDIWGHTDSLGNEYAIVGCHNGTSILNVTKPSAIREVYFHLGASSIWRDMKTYKNYAYITNEQANGLLILDLRHMPDSSTISSNYFTGSLYPFTTAHNLYIDEKGYCYIFGSDYKNGGAIVLDLNSNPTNPTEVGVWNGYYLHDGVVRGDTLWGGAVKQGFLAVLDVSNKSNITQYATHPTPSNFTHNVWFSDDNQYVFTTDEVSGGFITAYDVSNLSNIQEVDRTHSSPGSGVIPHNTHFINNYLVTSHYRDGVVIHDVTYPGNMIQVGNFDSSPTMSGNGFNGDWGAYPWLPSGNIIISDIEEGVFVLGPKYERGCYLEGTVTNASTGDSLSGVQVSIIGQTAASANTNLSGFYQTGVADSNLYDVAFAKSGFYPDTAYGVLLDNGVLKVLNWQLISQTPFALQGKVIDKATKNPVPYAYVIIENQFNSFNVQANASGVFNIPVMYEGNYQVTAGQWEYQTQCMSNEKILSSISQPYTIELDKGYYDDFTFDYSWTKKGSATSGIWVRDEPFGTLLGSAQSNPEYDVATDCKDQAYVTGNDTTGQVGADDVDGGETILTSPIFDLSNYIDPYIHYETWFVNGGGMGNPNDTMRIDLTDGITTVNLEKITATSGQMSTWVSKSFQVSNYLNPSSTMQLIVTAGDYNPGHIVEAGLDYFYIEEKSTIGVSELTDGVQKLEVYPNPSGEAFNISWQGMEPASIKVYSVSGQLIETINVKQHQKYIRMGANLESGVYVIKLIDGTKEELGTRKLVKF